LSTEISDIVSFPSTQASIRILMSRWCWLDAS